MTVHIDGPSPGDGQACERILRALPGWFGIEEALVQYVRDVQRLPTFSARAEGELVGFLSLREHFPQSWEIHVMAIDPAWHRRGAGRALVAAAESWLGSRGTQFLQVKTLSPARESAEYAATRQFYQAMGFVPLEEFPTLWSPRNPCLMMVKTVY